MSAILQKIAVEYKEECNDLLDFVNTVFDDDGKFIVENMIATPSKKACRYCEFLKTDDCTEGIC